MVYPGGVIDRTRGRDRLALGLLAGVFFGGVALVGAFGSNFEYSSGARVGKVTKFSQKGIVWKTYEGEMVLGGLRNTKDSEGRTGVAANVWEFSLDNSLEQPKLNDLSGKLTDAMNNDHTVKLTYSQKLWTWPWRSETDYLIENVELVK